ncbi:MAG TPA: hypothetical protein VL832_13445 [Puia sp.]|jgi:hypothetical protein|nr:hypothetical protein [Puia sp.]
MNTDKLRLHKDEAARWVTGGGWTRPWSLDRDRAARWVFGALLVIFFYRYFTHSLVHQLQQPVLSQSDFDYTYWLYHFTRFPDVFVQHRTGAFLFDGVLLASTLYCWATRGGRRGIVVLSALCWSLYGLTYNSYSYHHNHAVIGIMVLPYVFLAKEESSFTLAWDGMRYFCLYIYVDAFFIKTFIGQNVAYFPAGVEFIKTNQSAFMLQHPGSALRAVYAFFLTHPRLSYAGFVSMVLLQGCMVVGFFTRKWDQFLFFIPLVFHCITYFFIDVFFFELLILNLTLLPAKKGPDAHPVSRPEQE